MEEILLYFSIIYQGDYEKILKALKTKEVVDYKKKEMILKEVKSKYTTIISDDYPKALKEINCPPIVLFYYGDLTLINEKLVGVIGMRNPSNYGLKVTTHIVKKLVENDYVIVSGMARGVDGIAHRSAINFNGKTIAVLGSGIDFPYPKANIDIYKSIKDSCLVISEYPGATKPTKDKFPIRNRLIAGLSSKLIVTEARLKSGTMITANFALDQGKDIYVVPNDYFNINDGCNYLIQQGAFLLTKDSDLFE